MTGLARALLDPSRRENIPIKRVFRGREGLADLRSILDTRTDDDAGFEARADIVRLGYYDLRRVAIPACTMTIGVDEHATPAAHETGVGQAPEEEAAMWIAVRSGALRIELADRVVELTARSAALLLTSIAAVATTTGPTSVVMVSAPTAPLDAMLLVHPHTILTWSPESLLANATAAFVATLIGTDTFPLPAVTAMRVGRALDGLFATLWLGQQTAHLGAEATDAERRSQLLAYVAYSFTNPDFDSETLAERFGMSQRSIQRLFESTTTTPHALIQGRRAEHAMALLMDGRFSALSMEEIATRSGFSDTRQLRRWLKAAIGVTAADLRRQEAERAAAEARTKADANAGADADRDADADADADGFQARR